MDFMKKYELMTISKLSLTEDGARSLSNSVKDAISGFGGKILDDNFWGKRKFAYAVNKEKEGFYDVVSFEMDPEGMLKFRMKLNLIEGLVRYLITAKG